MRDRLYTADECRTLDRLAIEGAGVSGFELMRRAGDAAFAELLRSWPRAAALSVCCGKGNNAGDGYIVAGLARRLGLRVELLQIGPPAQLMGDAALARDWAAAQGVVPQVTGSEAPELAGDVIVDGMLGTGLRGPLQGPFAALTERINGADRPVLALDIPTGVEADTGAVAGAAVRAEVTVTFIGRKIGLYTGAGVAAAGRVVFADLGVGEDFRRRIAGVPLLDYARALQSWPLPERDADAYKQALGHAVVIGGDTSMGGAPLMAAETALRMGAGMVTVITRACHRSAILARRPELMVVDADDAPLRRALLAKAAVLIVGPGLGRADWGLHLLREALATGLPMVLDADGLHGFAEQNLTATGPLVVTPHTGEAAALLGVSIREVQENRPESALALARRTGGVSVLKGAGTVIAGAADRHTPAPTGADGVLGICAHGNPGMATAGMGDVLAGVIGGLLAQSMAPAPAALLGVALHSRAGDLAAERLGQRSLLATDLLPVMIELMHSGSHR